MCNKFLKLEHIAHKKSKNVNRKVKGVPQSQANPRHQEEEKNDKN